MNKFKNVKGAKLFMIVTIVTVSVTIISLFLSNDVQTDVINFTREYAGQRSSDEIIQLIYEGKVERISYIQDQPTHDSFMVTLKDGSYLMSRHIDRILSTIKKCGEPCNDIKIDSLVREETCGQACL